MGVTEFHLRLHWPSYRESLEKLKPSRGLFRNFQSCPHCKIKGRDPFVERINECPLRLYLGQMEKHFISSWEIDRFLIRLRNPPAKPRW